jgi:hypothetical protein
MPRPLPSTFPLIHYSLIIPSLDAIGFQSELLTRGIQRGRTVKWDSRGGVVCRSRQIRSEASHEPESVLALLQAITANVTRWAAYTDRMNAGRGALHFMKKSTFSGVESFREQELEKQCCFYLSLLLLLFLHFLIFFPRILFPFPSFLDVTYILSVPLFSYF